MLVQAKGLCKTKTAMKEMNKGLLEPRGGRGGSCYRKLPALHLSRLLKQAQSWLYSYPHTL